MFAIYLVNWEVSPCRSVLHSHFVLVTRLIYIGKHATNAVIYIHSFTLLIKCYPPKKNMFNKVEGSTAIMVEGVWSEKDFA